MGKDQPHPKRFPPSLHLNRTVNAQNGPLTPKEFLADQLERFVPQGAKSEPNTPLHDARELLAGDDQLGWDQVTDLVIRLASNNDISQISKLVADAHAGREGGRKRSAKARAWRGLFDEILRDLVKEEPEVLRRTKQEVLTAVLKDERAASIDVKEGTVRAAISVALGPLAFLRSSH